MPRHVFPITGVFNSRLWQEETCESSSSNTGVAENSTLLWRCPMHISKHLQMFRSLILLQSSGLRSTKEWMTWICRTRRLLCTSPPDRIFHPSDSRRSSQKSVACYYSQGTPLITEPWGRERGATSSLSSSVGRKSTCNPAVLYFSASTHKRHDYLKRENVIEHETCILICSPNLSEALLILGRTERDMIKNVYWSSCKAPLTHVRF
jgi:hypothetical protein